MSWTAGPTVETLLSISVAVGALSCIFICICHIVRRAANSARKNTAVYRRDSSRQSSRRDLSTEQTGSIPMLHHGGRQLQELESHPLQPLFVSSPVPRSCTRGCRSCHSSHSQNPNSHMICLDNRMEQGRVISPPHEVVYPDYVERVALPNVIDRMDSSAIEDIYSAEMNEAPPPYDCVDDHMDTPAPPAYSDLFPYKT